jgi:hypothetical protein
MQIVHPSFRLVDRVRESSTAGSPKGACEHLAAEQRTANLVHLMLINRRGVPVRQPVRRTFPGEQSQIACARDFVKRTVGRCTMQAEAILLTSELCTNSLEHTASGRSGSFEVTV